jgi:hypothetical protein
MGRSLIPFMLGVMVHAYKNPICKRNRLEDGSLRPTLVKKHETPSKT